MEIERNFQSKAKLSLTPLIDMVFLLVVFFMLTTTFASNEAIDIGFAGDTGEVRPSEKDSIIVEVRKNGLVTVGKKIFRHADFREHLRKILKKDPKTKILLTSSSSATVQDVVIIMDEIQLAGGSDIIFIEREEK